MASVCATGSYPALRKCNEAARACAAADPGGGHVIEHLRMQTTKGTEAVVQAVSMEAHLLNPRLRGTATTPLAHCQGMAPPVARTIVRLAEARNSHSTAIETAICCSRTRKGPVLPRRLKPAKTRGAGITHLASTLIKHRKGTRPMPAITPTPMPRRHERRYAIVQDRATQAQYIWNPDTDEWYGPFATRWDAELTLVRARKSPDRCPH